MLPFTRRRLYWVLQVTCWGLYALLGITIFKIMGQLTVNYVLAQLCIVALNIGASHLLRAVIRRGGWLRLPVLAVVPRLLVANFLLSLVTQLLISAIMMYVVGMFKPADFSWVALFLYTLYGNFVFWLWALLYFGLHYLDSYKRAEVDKWKLLAAVQEAEMRMLKAQINPHFMFNGLNNIRALVTENPARARDMITHLSDLLRYSIQLNSTEKVTLAREVEIVEHYLALEAMQLEERLTYTLDVVPDTLNVLIPPMTLQLLVENAIKHGIAPRPDGGTIELTARLSGARLLVTVRNTGQYQPRPGHEGVGVRNARERLQLLFGSAAGLLLHNDPTTPDTVVAELHLPAGQLPQPAVAATAAVSA
ncbi:sensor histidine kinase [Hymenobacter cellulosilyticus]|uniref:Histidine kinase n=1 Tax=Hymenobacter cellulosilyticus TaxID=2932248 RepID=A0A8T9QG68_9BACT|nr:histidine kinase [Hymenobacter cellulosilyticus]UOQ74820.1 histidine kinase [Hymenobacter cellulosilyticus]